MKRLKVLISLFFSALLLSCSNDKANEETDPQETDTDLVKKIIFTYESPNYQRTNTYTLSYDGNKLSSVKQAIQEAGSSSDYTLDFNYTGDFITSIDNWHGEVLSSHYTYSGDRLMSTYFSNTATELYSYQTVNNQTRVDMVQTSAAKWHFIHENNKVVKEGRSSYNTPEYFYDCSYDNKKNPFHNITGLDKLHLNNFFTSPLDRWVLLRKGENNLTGLQSSVLNHVTISYTYNNDGYPTKAVIASPVDNMIANVEYFY